MRQDIKHIVFDPSKWAMDAQQEPDGAIKALYDDAIAHGNRAVEWYEGAKKVKATVSSTIRTTAIGGAALAGAVPLAATLATEDWKDILTLTGYGIAAVVAGALAYDRFFGLSSGWIRYMTTLATINRLRTEFALDWAKLLRESTVSPPNDSVLKFLERATNFRKDLMVAIEAETSAWVAEFRASMNELEQLVQKTSAAAEASFKEQERARAERQQKIDDQAAKDREAQQPGALNLTLVPEWEDEVEIFIGNKSHKKTSGRSAAMMNLSPPTAIIEVRGKKGGHLVTESKSVTIKPNEIVELTL